MDALVCTSPGQLRIEQRPTPRLQPGQALVKPRRIGICGTDYHILEGKHPFLQYPRVMGHELAVEVVNAPSGSGFSPGDMCVVNPYISCGICHACSKGKPNCCVKISVLGVHQDGGMQQLIAMPTGNLIKSDGLTADECATVEFLAIGAHAVRRGMVAKEDRVAVVGAGPIGLGVALFASLSGAKVAVLDRDPERVSAAKSITGAEPIVTDDGYQKKAARFTSDCGFDVVFDATGSATAMQAGFDLVAHGGRYVLVSVVKDNIMFADPDFHRKEMTLFGSRNATSQDFELVMAAIRDRKVPIDKIITHRTSLLEAVNKMPQWAQQKSGLIKALVEID
ncbi:MAG: zinc-binding alcohol dehydrogenase family protein [Aestuariivirga sp.]|nr:zinc-binding alcohol dehydrogenase family protein [Aestuariivirga sp.]